MEYPEFILISNFSKTSNPCLHNSFCLSHKNNQFFKSSPRIQNISFNSDIHHQVCCDYDLLNYYFIGHSFGVILKLMKINVKSWWFYQQFKEFLHNQSYSNCVILIFKELLSFYYDPKWNLSYFRLERWRLLNCESKYFSISQNYENLFKFLLMIDFNDDS